MNTAAIIVFCALLAAVIGMIIFFITEILISIFHISVDYVLDYMYNKRSISSIIKKGEKGLMARVTCFTPRYADVWVKSFIDPDEPGLGYVTYKEILFHGSQETHTWTWIEMKSAYGWVERRKTTVLLPEKPKEPPVPMFLASSEEALNDAEAILEQYRKDTYGEQNEPGTVA